MPRNWRLSVSYKRCPEAEKKYICNTVLVCFPAQYEVISIPPVCLKIEGSFQLIISCSIASSYTHQYIELHMRENAMDQ